MLFRSAAQTVPERTVRMMAALFWQFLFYSFSGFLLEVAYARLSRTAKQDRKCHLLLPVCPVYGIGGLLLGLLPGSVTTSPFLLFLMGAAVCTAAEWGMSLFYEKAARTAFWDYSALPWNLGGRVCLLFSFAWGLLALPVTYVIQPHLSRWSSGVPAGITLFAALLYLADAAFSLYLLRRGGTDSLLWYRRVPGFRLFSAHRAYH